MQEIATNNNERNVQTAKVNCCSSLYLQLILIFVAKAKAKIMFYPYYQEKRNIFAYFLKTT